MKEKLHKAGSFAMALLLLLSTLSFSMDMHYCGDHLVDFSLFDKAAGCGMEVDAPADATDCDMLQADMGCCSDVQILVEGQDDLQGSFDQLSFDQQLFLASFVYSWINRFDGVESENSINQEYSPPPLLRNVQVLHQTFLI